MRHTLTITMVAGLAVFSVMSGPALPKRDMKRHRHSDKCGNALTKQFHPENPA